MVPKWLCKITKCQYWHFSINTLITAGILLIAFCLRFFGLTANPPSLYWDEIALAYDSWSIATTGHDVHGQLLPATAFASYGDYKPSGYFYAAAFLMKIIGVHDWVVRLPSVFAGIFIVYALGKLIVQLFGRQKIGKIPLSWIVMLLATFNPALLHLSRAAFETNLSVAYFLAGIILLLHHSNDVAKESASSCKWRLIAGEIFLLLAFYTYHAMRVIAPLTGLYLIISWIWRHRQQKPVLAINLSIVTIIGLICTTPFILQLTSNTIINRFQTTSIFSDLSIIEASNTCYQLSNHNLLSKLFCHRYLYYTASIIEHFASHFSFDYLFFHGDANLRHSIGVFGVYYPLEIIPLFLGLVWLTRRYTQYRASIYFCLFLLIIGIIPASLTTDTPHLLRTLCTVPLGLIIIALGWQEFFALIWYHWRKSIAACLIITYLGFVTFWGLYYWRYYRFAAASQWQDGYHAAYTQLAILQNQYPNLPVYITRAVGRPAYYYFWYHQIKPQQVQAVHDEQDFDQAEFRTYTPDKISFGTGWTDIEQLFMLTPAEYDTLTSTPSATIIEDIAGTPVFYLGHYLPSITESLP